MLDIWCSLSPPAAPWCLSADEVQRRDRFAQPRLRDAYAGAHSLKRRVLSHYLPEHAPLSWQFVSGAAGKPAAAPPFPHCFNLSHSDHCVAIAIADAEVGVDIERLRPMPSAPSLAQWVLHVDERRWYERHGHDLETFFRLWTLKEALLKAAG